MAGVDRDFLVQMEKHKQQEMELLAKIAMKAKPSPANTPGFGSYTGSTPSPMSTAPSPMSDITGRTDFLASSDSRSSFDRSLFRDPTYQQPLKRKRSLEPNLYDALNGP
jgi:hypothetical protein